MARGTQRGRAYATPLFPRIAFSQFLAAITPQLLRNSLISAHLPTTLYLRRNGPGNAWSNPAAGIGCEHGLVSLLGYLEVDELLRGD